MNQPILSVIVPVFNKGRYLERGVRSILDQGLKEDSFEIILVDDGSTDNSLDVCRELEAANSPVRVISQSNHGASSARNTGIDASKGEYVCFLDADDTYSSDGIPSIVSLCDGKVDVVRFWCEVVKDGKKRDNAYADGRVSLKGTGKEWIRKFGLETFCVNCLFRKDFLNNRDIRFRDGILGEDYMFMFEVLIADPTIVSVNRIVYLYDIANSGITVNRDKRHSRLCEESLSGFLSTISKEVDTFKPSDPVLWGKARFSLDLKVLSLFSRILQADYSLRAFKEKTASFKDSGLLPFSEQSDLSLRVRLAKMVVEVMVKVPFAYLPAKLLYKVILGNK